MGLGKEYISRLREAYAARGNRKFAELEAVACGMSDADEAMLRERYPDIPDALAEILRAIDGTCWREYAGEEWTCYFFGSDVDGGEYPYYLHSAQQIMDNIERAENLFELYFGFFVMDEDLILIDERINKNLSEPDWLWFSDCMNNGGTSSMFIDFLPSEKGKKGQIVRFLHDPDRLEVIADSFDEFLQMLMDRGMPFIRGEV